jgi:YidC/Oxa1 family membrane protein insertase
MLAENARRGRKPAGPRKNVLIGPSWDPRGLLNTCGERLVELLLKSSYQVVLRPHPISFKKSKAVIDAITRRFGQDPLFRLETSTTTQDSLYDSDIMIADWSGLSMEYAFGLERPQVFIDVPRKVNNPSYQDLGLEPVEAAFREDVGAVVTPGELEKVPAAIERLCADPARFKDRIAALREKYVYNPGASGPAGAKIIAELADRARQQVAHV